MPLNTDTIRAGASGATGGTSFYPTTIDQSLRFNYNDSAYLSLSPAQTGDSRKKFTFSCWVKRCSVGTEHVLFSAGADASSATGIVYFYFSSSDTLAWYRQFNGSGETHYITSALYRDTSAWYHVVLVEDANTTSHKIYVNGVEQPYGTTTAGGNTNSPVGTTEIHTIGRRSWTASSYLNGYMAEVNFLDNITVGETNGYLDEFGELKNGIWIPKAYTGSYGTNGFRLTFADSSNIGEDNANANDWTANNLTAVDVVPDSPTNNFPTINVLHRGSSYSSTTTSEGNLSFKHSNLAHASAIATTALPKSGKWYWETLNNSNATSGTNTVGCVVSTYNNSNALSGAGAYFWASGFGIYGNTGANFGSTPSVTWDTTGSATTFTANDIIGVAYDADNKNVEWYKNGVKIDYNVTDFDDDGNDLIPASSAYGNPANAGIVLNFGQDSSFAGGKTSGSANASDDNGIGDFYYSPPSGFLTLCASNLQEPTIGPNSETQADDYFNTTLYQSDNIGAGGTQSITDVGFQPDLVWIKNRDSSGTSHTLFDSVRLAGKMLQSDNNSLEASNSQYGYLSSFDSNGSGGGGFTLTGGTTNANFINQGTDDYVSWNWKAGGTAVLNEQGSINSNVSANTDAGFSIVSYTSNNSAGATVGHGLGVAPQMVIIKKRSASERWFVWHTGDSTEYIYLNESFAGQANLDDRFGNNTTVTLPSSTLLTLGTNNDVNGTSGSTYIAYCFAEIEGYSKFGTYEGNLSTDGTFVYTGFRPAFVMIKNADETGYNWYIYDNTRKPYNNNSKYLIANTDGLETDYVGDSIDHLSNGFKLRTLANGRGTNRSATYIYMAFADGQPFKYANAR